MRLNIFLDSLTTLVFWQVPPDLTAKKVLYQLNKKENTVNFLVGLIIEESDSTIATGIFLQQSNIAIKDTLSPFVLLLLSIIFMKSLAENLERIVLRRITVIDILR